MANLEVGQLRINNVDLFDIFGDIYLVELVGQQETSLTYCMRYDKSLFTLPYARNKS